MIYQYLNVTVELAVEGRYYSMTHPVQLVRKYLRTSLLLNNLYSIFLCCGDFFFIPHLNIWIDHPLINVR